jgi:hypothetical protein
MIWKETYRSKVHLLVFLLWILTLTLQAKDSGKSQPYLQLLFHKGVHVNRSTTLDKEFDGGFKAMEVRLGFRTFGSEDWQQVHHYPKYGVGVHYADQIKNRKDTVIGNPVSVFGFFNAPITRFGRFSLNTNISAGLSYTSVIFDPVENPLNDLVASHINLYFDCNLNLGVELAERWDLTLGYGVTHYSNGNIQEPQKGLNNWGWNLGASYLFGTGQKPFQRAEYIHSDLPEFKPYEEIQLMMSVGINEWQPDSQVKGQHYFASSFTADYAYRFSRRSSVTLWTDIMYDGSLEEAIKGIPPDEVTTLQKFYLAGHIGYQYRINMLTLLFNVGSYFFQSSYDRRFFFSRAGGRIHLTDNLAVHICIKSRNGIRSDWIEWGMAYSLKTR